MRPLRPQPTSDEPNAAPSPAPSRRRRRIRTALVTLAMAVLVGVGQETGRHLATETVDVVRAVVE